jgi:hypothetical protein
VVLEGADDGQRATARAGADVPSHRGARPSESRSSDLPWERDDDESGEPVDLEEIEAAEERQVDGILSRLHAHGMNSLTADERQLLIRVSARYRNRLGRRT